ncbi:uncharacterized protein F4812DRAFT_310715 [Daldinia caldariorum]|uniref:uncharacterized protein n=1 Tax=Daldinia caldariorum TaxID=326644 RepID=UPI0020085D92|nr:uncharacterized protein F4812DRAFT_310715 [Daldinia caldariorum]KAI1470038.1 hypothetical protein F4812DRAFT_310715 [Daldinia caldariorum]
MANLPEGWEADYDGSRWFYRYKTTGLTQYHFPRPGDEFPELVGIGFGPLDLTPKNGLGDEYQGALKNAVSETSNVRKTNLTDGNDHMGATGYFDPDNFMYFGLNDISPAGNESNTTTDITTESTSPMAELGSTQVRSPVGFISELASSDTAKCAEELAPIELDATQISQTPSKSNVHRNGIAELSTEKSPRKEKVPVQHPVQTMEPVDEYPLVSASFAYPPLKKVAKPADDINTEPPQVEQKVIASQRPVATYLENNENETWKPTSRIANEEARNPNRNSITLSGIPVLQSQNTELGPIDQKRHSLSRPVESPGEISDHPGIQKPSDPRLSTTTSTSPSEVEPSPIPTVLRPDHDLHGTSGNQRPTKSHTDMARPGTHRVNTLPNPPSSYTPSLLKIGGPGIQVSQEISAATGSTAEQSKLHNPVTASPVPNGQGASTQKPHQPLEHSHSAVDEPIPVVAPISTSRPQKPASPDWMLNTSFQGSIPSSPAPQNKPQSQPVVSQSSGNASATMGLASIPVRPHPASQQGRPPSIGSPGPNSTAQVPAPSTVPQGSPLKPSGQPIQTHNYHKPSISVSSQNSPQVSQGSSTTHMSSSNTQAQGQVVINNTYNSQTPIQRPNHGTPATIQSLVGPSASFSNQPATVHAISSNPQRPPSSSPSSPRPQNNQQAPAPHTMNQQPNQNTAMGIAIGQHKPQSPSPIANPVSPLQSQVSSPAPSIASLNRPPSSASSHTYGSAQSVAAQNRPPNTSTPHQYTHQNTYQNTAQVIRPTMAQTSQSQVNQQATIQQVTNQQVIQSPSPSTTGGSKPFPMLPGQVTPLPSQMGSPPTFIPNNSAPATTAPAHHGQGQTALGYPTQQQAGPQQIVQATVQRPPQPQLMNGNHSQLSGSPIPGQPTQMILQHGQPRPTIQGAPGQQPANGQNIPTYIPQSPDSINQISNGQNGQVVANMTHGAHAQSPASYGVQSPISQQFSGQSPIQGQQQQTQTPGLYSNFPQISGQSKPFTSAQAAAALSDAGKKMKKWAKKTWQNPALKQSSAAIGGAIIAESMGMNGTTGAALGNNIYSNYQGQPQGQLQGGQQQRPPSLQHAYTAPPQTQTVQGANIASPQMQAMNRPPLQQGSQPVGVQTPGRPPMVQNPGLPGTLMNYNAAQPNMTNQQTSYQIPRPPVGRPQLSQMQQRPQIQQQMQQPAAFGQPAYQTLPNQPVFQGPPGQPLYQVHPNQIMPLNQPGYQAPGTADAYVAIGATIGGALTALSGSKNNGPAPVAQQHQAAPTEQQHYSQQPEPQPQHEPQHQTYSEQQHGGQSEQHHTGQSEQYHGGEGHTEQQQQHTNQPEPHHESYSGQHQETYTETHQQAHAEQSYTSHNEQPNAEYPPEDQPTYSAPGPAQSQPAPAPSEPYFAPQPETAMMINNTVINNIENNTAIAESTQTNANYVDDSNYINNSNSISNSNVDSNSNTTQVVVVDTTQMNMNYADNSHVDNTSASAANYTTSAQPPAFAAAVDTDPTVNADNTAQAGVFSEATTYVDFSNMNMDMGANPDMNAFADNPTITTTTMYADTSSYAVDANYMDANANATYIDSTAVVDVSMNMNVNVDMMSQTGYVDDMSMMTTAATMEGSVSVDASASYMEVGAVDYSGGDWGGGEW